MKTEQRLEDLGIEIVPPTAKKRKR